MEVSTNNTALARIAQVVAAHFDVNVERMTQPTVDGRRGGTLADKPRQIAMLLMRESGASYPEIGRFFGRHHSSVIYACRTATEECEPGVLADIRARLSSPTTPGCSKCSQLMTELLQLKVEVLEMRARLAGCG